MEYGSHLVCEHFRISVKRETSALFRRRFCYMFMSQRQPHLKNNFPLLLIPQSHCLASSFLTNNLYAASGLSNSPAKRRESFCRWCGTCKLIGANRRGFCQVSQRTTDSDGTPSRYCPHKASAHAKGTSWGPGLRHNILGPDISCKDNKFKASFTGDI